MTILGSHAIENGRAAGNHRHADIPDFRSSQRLDEDLRANSVDIAQRYREHRFLHRQLHDSLLQPIHSDSGHPATQNHDYGNTRRRKRKPAAHRELSTDFWVIMS